jgi:hypothetical protein
MTPLDISNNFVNEILGNETRTGKCYHVCYPLSLFLEIKQHPNQIMRGTFKRTESEVGTNHYWLQLDADQENIIDPTKCQFYPNEKCSVYYGTKSKQYKDPDNNQLKNEPEQWLGKYTNSAQVNYKEYFNPNIDSFLSVTLRAAILITNNIPDKRRISVYPKLLEYFKGIHAILAYQTLHNQQTIAALKGQPRQEFKTLIKFLNEELGFNCNW